jgi:phosphoglycerol transferase MdoB-like AlkP superfamily enzyme
VLILGLGVGTSEIGVTNTPPGFYKGIFVLKDRNDLYATITAHDIQHKKIYEPPVLKGTAQEKPNIVLVVMESARARSFSFSSYAGNSTARTPFLNQLAAKSLVVDNTYATVTHTSKALVGILCGMYPKLIMPITESAPNGLPLKCLPQYLNEIGYKTAFFQTAPGSFENRPGLIKNIGYSFLETQETIDQKGFGKAGYFGLDEFAMIEPSLSWIKKNKTSPFFLTYLTVLSHHPYELPNENSFNTNDVTKYNATLEHTDKFIENIYDNLKHNGLLDNTVLMIIGDHGEGFGEHGVRLHDVVPYEEATRVPFIIHNPKWLDNIRKTRGLRHQVDLLPTIFDILKVDWTGYLPGKSVLTPEGHDYTVTSCFYDNFCLSMRKGDYKYIYHFRNMPVEMFNIAKDPEEINNLATQESVNNLAYAIKELLSFKSSVDHYYNSNDNKTNNQELIKRPLDEKNNLASQESVNNWAYAIKELLSFKFLVDHSDKSNGNKINNQELIERPSEETDI